MTSLTDDDGYWNRSGGKAFSFDDDEEDRHAAAVDTLEPCLDSGEILNDYASSEASFANDDGAVAYNLSIKTLISDEALTVLLDEQATDDNLIPKGMRPEEELKLLRRQLQNTIHTPSASSVARKLLCGKVVSLELFKSLSDKELLLDAVLGIGEMGDGILFVVLFLERTLNRSDFLAIISRRPKALQHYIAFLATKRPSEAIALQRSLGRHNDELLLELQMIFNSNNLAERKVRLSQLLGACDKKRLSAFYLQMLQAAQKLTALLETYQSQLGKDIEVNSSPVEVLYACCCRNNSWKDPDISQALSPNRLCSELQISAPQYEWTALNERANAKAYGDLPDIFEQVPTWHPSKQKQFHISFAVELAVTRLHALEAPAPIIHRFLSHMPNNGDKLELAKRVGSTKAVIDVLASLKDVAQLTALRASLPDRSEEQFYCDNALKSAQSKRWTSESIKLKL